MPLPNNGVRGSVTFQQSRLKCQRIHQVAGAWFAGGGGGGGGGGEGGGGLKSKVIKQEGNEIIYMQNRSS